VTALAGVSMHASLFHHNDAITRFGMVYTNKNDSSFTVLLFSPVR